MRTAHLLSVVLLAAACGRAEPLTRPTDAQPFFYPTSLTLSADGQRAFVVNANFNQRFSSGWLSSFDVAALIAAVEPAAVVQRQAYIPSLGGSFALSADGRQGLVPHRGSGLLTLIDVAADGLGATCAAPDSTQGDLPRAWAASDCDRGHLVDLHAALEARLGTAVPPRALRDPLAAVALPPPAADRWAVSFLSSSYLLSLQRTPAGVQLQEVALLPATLSGTMLADVGAPQPDGTRAAPQLILGSAALAPPQPGSVVQSIDVAGLLATPLGGTPPRTLGDVAQSVGGSRVVATALDPAGQHLYALSRSPDALLVLRRAAAAQTAVPGGPVSLAAPELRVSAALALDHVRFGALAYVPRAGGDLLVASGIDTQTLYFFDPQGDTLALVGTLKVDGGAGLLALASTQSNGRTLLLATAFYDHALLAFDISAADPAAFTQLLAVRSRIDEAR